MCVKNLIKYFLLSICPIVVTSIPNGNYSRILNTLIYSDMARK